MSLNHEKYNVPFTASELLDALHKSHDTAGLGKTGKIAGLDRN